MWYWGVEIGVRWVHMGQTRSIRYISRMRGVDSLGLEYAGGWKDGCLARGGRWLIPLRMTMYDLGSP